jgi:hypothetical protein
MGVGRDRASMLESENLKREGNIPKLKLFLNVALPIV